MQLSMQDECERMSLRERWSDYIAWWLCTLTLVCKKNKDMWNTIMFRRNFFLTTCLHHFIPLRNSQTALIQRHNWKSNQPTILQYQETIQNKIYTFLHTTKWWTKRRRTNNKCTRKTNNRWTSQQHCLLVTHKTHKLWVLVSRLWVFSWHM